MPEKAIYSRVTIIDRATLYVTESQGDFASTVLEQVVNENVPAFTHNPPTIIILEAGFNEDRDDDLPVITPTPLARRVYRELWRELDLQAEPAERNGTAAS